jgi:hypothetical protein
MRSLCPSLAAIDFKRSAGHNGFSPHRADVAELADAHDSGSCARNGVEVQVLSSAPGSQESLEKIIRRQPTRPSASDMLRQSAGLGTMTLQNSDSRKMVSTGVERCLLPNASPSKT